jgi:tetratricopeptide (TPR) repeat protein
MKILSSLSKTKNVISATLLICSMAIITLISTARAEVDPYKLFEEGKAHLENQELKDAVEKFSRTLYLLSKTDPVVPMVLLYRAEAYCERAIFRSAREDADQALNSPYLENVTRAWAWQIKGRANLGEGLLPLARQDFTHAIKISHKNLLQRADSYAYRGKTFALLGDMQSAQRDLNRAIALDRRLGLAYAYRGMVYLRTGAHESARRDALSALRLDPTGETAKVARAVLKAKPAPIPYSEEPLSVTVPVSKNGHIFVKVRFSEDGPAHNFLLDTGATHSLISRGLLKQIRRETRVVKLGKMLVRTADGAKHRITRYKIKTAYLYNLPLGEIEVSVFDRAQSGAPLHLLGVKSLKRVSISINNRTRKAEIRGADFEEE